MPTKPLTREQIERRAAEDAAVLAEFHRQDQERAQAAAQRRAEPSTSGTSSSSPASLAPPWTRTLIRPEPPSMRSSPAIR